MNKSLAMKSLVLAAILAVICMSGISYAEETSNTQPVKETGAALHQLENAAGKNMGCANASASNGLALESQSISRDGAACSSNDECKSKVCEGGSCCTDYGDPCDSTSHCCGRQSCNNGKCPN